MNFDNFNPRAIGIVAETTRAQAFLMTVVEMYRDNDSSASLKKPDGGVK